MERWEREYLDAIRREKEEAGAASENCIPSRPRRSGAAAYAPTALLTASLTLAAIAFGLPVIDASLDGGAPQAVEAPPAKEPAEAAEEELDEGAPHEDPAQSYVDGPAFHEMMSVVDAVARVEGEVIEAWNAYGPDIPADVAARLSASASEAGALLGAASFHSSYRPLMQRCADGLYYVETALDSLGEGDPDELEALLRACDANGDARRDEMLSAFDANGVRYQVRDDGSVAYTYRR